MKPGSVQSLRSPRNRRNKPPPPAYMYDHVHTNAMKQTSQMEPRPNGLYAAYKMRSVSAYPSSNTKNMKHPVDNCIVRRCRGMSIKETGNACDNGDHCSTAAVAPFGKLRVRMIPAFAWFSVSASGWRCCLPEVELPNLDAGILIVRWYFSLLSSPSHVFGEVL